MFEGRRTWIILCIFQCFALTGIRVDRVLSTPTKCPWMFGYAFCLMIYFFSIGLNGFKDKGVIPDLKEIARFLTDIIAFCLTFISIGIVLIQVLLTRESQAKMLSLFNEVDFLASTKLGVMETNQLVSTITKLLLMSTLFVLQEATTMYTVFELNQYRDYWIYMLQPVTIGFVRMLQFIFTVDMLKHRLTLVNDCIRALMEGSQESEMQWLYAEKELEKRFEVVRKIYNRLYDIYVLINTIFGNSMLLLVFQNFVFLCTNTYWSILQHTEKISSIFPLGNVYPLKFFTTR